jgi:hypothetical protein
VSRTNLGTVGSGKPDFFMQLRWLGVGLIGGAWIMFDVKRLDLVKSAVKNTTNDLEWCRWLRRGYQLGGLGNSHQIDGTGIQ